MPPLALVVAIVPAQQDNALLPTHEMVTWVSLKLSGRSQPYTRADLHRRAAATGSLPEKNNPRCRGNEGLEHWRCSGQALLPT
ncbi:MAG: hypothetical protein EOO24_64055 [Comamonadaceae bacterium]|nr:MAG: hypothetical protein EOO24_64055 [Comamonadaceae bacterium]